MNCCSSQAILTALPSEASPYSLTCWVLRWKRESLFALQLKYNYILTPPQTCKRSTGQTAGGQESAGSLRKLQRMRIKAESGHTKTCWEAELPRWVGRCSKSWSSSLAVLPFSKVTWLKDTDSKQSERTWKDRSLHTHGYLSEWKLD